MHLVDRIAPTGWLVAAALSIPFASACETLAPPETVSSSTITSADAYREALDPERLPPTAELTACAPAALAPVLAFRPHVAELAPGEMRGLDHWGRCLNHPDQEHTTIVLTGSIGPDGPEGLFYERAQFIRRALILRGIDEHRIVLGQPKMVVMDGPSTLLDGIRVEPTYQQSIRSF
jgi:hypothetical protein